MKVPKKTMFVAFAAAAAAAPTGSYTLPPCFIAVSILVGLVCPVVAMELPPFLLPPAGKDDSTEASSSSRSPSKSKTRTSMNPDTNDQAVRMYRRCMEAAKTLQVPSPRFSLKKNHEDKCREHGEMREESF